MAALGHDPVEEGLQIASPAVADRVAHTVERAVARAAGCSSSSTGTSEDEFSQRRVEPYALINGARRLVRRRVRPRPGRTRHFRLDRIKRARSLDERFEPRPDLDPVADIEGWPRTGEVEGSRVARVWISPEQARWAREERTVVAELEDGAIVVEFPFKGIDYLVKEVLKEAGDAAVLEPPTPREAVPAPPPSASLARARRCS